MSAISFLGSLKTDVLVIGGGAAAARAAIAALEAGAETVLACKGVLGKSGNTPLGAYSFCAATGDADPEDSPEVHYADTMRAGCYLNEPELVRVLVEEAPAALRDLEGYGLRFDRENGRLAQASMPGYSRPRGCHVDMHTGRQMMHGLARRVGHLGIRVLEDHVALRVLTDSGAAAGASFLDVQAGGVVVVQAGAVVLATGGVGQLYPINSNATEVTGDGHALALRAGAGLIDMEMVQLHPCGLVRPAALRGATSPAGLLMGHGGQLRNARGERFMERHDPANMENATRAVLSRAISTEVLEGRGTAANAVYMDARHLSEDYLRNRYPGSYWFEYLLSSGLDLREEPMEVAPSAHYMMGGLAIDARCETDLPGLFAAGECTGGVHGANRLAGNALAETVVFGARAGRFAAQRAGTSSGGPVPELSTRADLEALRELLGRERCSSSIRGWKAKERLREIVARSAGASRSGAGITEGLARLTDFRGSLGRDLMVADRSATYSVDLVEAIEATNMALVAEAILKTAAERLESRGAHFRVDHPETSERYLQHVGNELQSDSSVGVRSRPIGFRGG